MEQIEHEVDLRCELEVEAGAALSNVSNSFVSEVNSRISTILDAYNLECLSSLLSIGGIDIPGFDTILNLNFCEIARDQILNRSGNFAPGGLQSVPQEKIDDAKSNILKRAQQTEDLIKQLEKGNGG